MILWLEKNKGISWAITISIFLLTFYLSSLSVPPPPAGPPSISATVYHISIFFLLAIFFFISVIEREWNSKKIILSVLIVTIYAALDELHQFFVPGRYMSFDDFLFNFAGITIASLIYFILIFWKKS